ncbi:hypothetical protein NBG4_860001 [Candidatus Sulfobium mesophilum]|uniref:Uncharacterized protein n=1 Tax=Candidatus Sulfobium mesophilum TaxID=2016548 RepID=A0A2U3QKT0_9BACT|nr:hypothetical protein NBG4_860001 [Candidatus Sulfobium mesophilum]
MYTVGELLLCCNFLTEVERKFDAENATGYKRNTHILARGGARDSVLHE